MVKSPFKSFCGNTDFYKASTERLFVCRFTLRPRGRIGISLRLGEAAWYVTTRLLALVTRTRTAPAPLGCLLPHGPAPAARRLCRPASPHSRHGGGRPRHSEGPQPNGSAHADPTDNCRTPRGSGWSSKEEGGRGREGRQGQQAGCHGVCPSGAGPVLPGVVSPGSLWGPLESWPLATS